MNIPKPRLVLNGWHVVEELAGLSLDPSFSEARREYFKMLARQVALDAAYMEILMQSGRLKPHPYAQREQVPGVAEKRLEEALGRAYGAQLVNLKSPSKTTN